MPALTVTVPLEAIEAFEQAARTLALAEHETEAGDLMAILLGALVALDVGEAMAGVPAPEGGEAVIFELGDRALADLKELAYKLGIGSDEAAGRILAAIATQGPAAALQAINSRRIGRRSRKDRHRR